MSKSGKSIRLTRRICSDLRIVLRRKTDALLVYQTSERERAAAYTHYRKVAETLDRETVRGGVMINMPLWNKQALLVLRELLFALMEECTQMQVRRAILKRIAAIEDYAEVSAVERLGNIVQLRVAS